MTLLQQSQNKSGCPSWPTLIIEAESSNEMFEDMRIITTKSEYIIRAKEMALTQLLTYQQEVFDEDIDKLAMDFIDSDKIQVFESAVLTQNGACVYLDVEVIDDEAIWKALDLVYQAVESGGKWISTIPLSYTISELPLLTH